jgi:hypothetical protein
MIKGIISSKEKIAGLAVVTAVLINTISVISPGFNLAGDRV